MGIYANTNGTLTPLAGGGSGSGAEAYSLLEITFDSDFSGLTYTLQADSAVQEEYEISTRTVPASLKDVVRVKQCNMRYVAECTIDSKQYTNSITTADYFGEYKMHLYQYHIYGARWTSDPSPVWERTDDAAEFTDPVPYAPDVTNYGSPFDNIYPWSEMTKHDDFYAGLIVTIPKFYYNLTEYGNGGLWIRISDKPVAGFGISPAHRKHYTPDDSDTEKNIICVGRYKSCSTGRSDTNTTIMSSYAYNEVWDRIAKLHPDVWGMDFDTLFSLWLLFLVEFANWDSKGVVGRGSTSSTTGVTDSMPYHTGTMGGTAGVQYRNIENLWAHGYKNNLTNILFLAKSTASGVQSNGYICDRLSTRTNDIRSLTFDSEWVYNTGPVTDGTWGSSSGYPTTFKIVNAPYKFFLPYEKGGSNITYTCSSMLPRNEVNSYNNPSTIMGINDGGGLFALASIATASPGRLIKLSEPEESIPN